MKVIGFGGNPATGKTTLMRAFIALLLERGDAPKEVEWGLVKGQAYPGHRVLVLGLYPEGETFGGTDRLSMGVQPYAQEFLRSLSEDPQWQNWAVVFEGDRLFNSKFLTFTREDLTFTGTSYFLLAASEHLLAARHTARADTQSAAWLKGRLTKVERLKAEFDLPVYRHETPEHTAALANILLSAVATEPGVVDTREGAVPNAG